MKNVFLIFLLMTYLSSFLFSQEFVTYESSFSIVEKNEAKQSVSIIKGKMSIDNANQKMVIDLSFPKIETWIMQDTFLVKMIKDSMISKSAITGYDKMTFYNQLMSLNKSDFGLKQLGFKIDKVDASKGMTSLTWSPPEQLKSAIGIAQTEVENNLLKSVFIFDSNNEEMMSSFISNYITLNGNPMPTKVMSKISSKNGVIYKSMEFKDIKIN